MYFSSVLKSHQSKAIIFLVYALVFAIFSLISHEMRYASYAYAVISVVMIIVIKYGVISMNGYFSWWSKFYFIIIGISSLFNWQVFFSNYFYKQAFLILIPVLFVGILFSRKRVLTSLQLKYLEKIFYISVYSIVLLTIIPVASKFDLGAINIIHSTSPLESGISHLMGMVFIYSFIKKSKSHMLFSFCFMVLFNKRIAIAAVILIILISLILKLFKKETKWKLMICTAVSMNTFYLWFIYDLVYGNITNSLFIKYVGLSMNQFTLGRFNIYQDLSKMVDFSTLFVGKGVGQVNVFMRNFAIYEHINYNPHSDVLRIFIEFGFVSGILWLFFLYKKSTIHRDYKYLLIPFYLNILMFTDNVILYHYVMIPFFVIIFLNQQQQLNERS